MPFPFRRVPNGRMIVRSIGLVFLLASCTSSAGSLMSPSAPPATVLVTPVPEVSPSASGVQASSATATMPPLDATFTSPKMGYSVKYPAAWTTSPATRSWRPGGSNFWDDAVGDRLESGSAGFRGTSQALAKGQSGADWLKAYLAASPSCGDREQIAVGGQLATIDLNGCPGLGRLGGRVYDLAVVAGNRGYNFTMEGDVDHALFLAMLATVSLDPKAGVD